MQVAVKILLLASFLCVAVRPTFAKIEGADTLRRLPDTNVVINADERRKCFQALLRKKRRVRFTPDGMAVDAGDGSNVKVKANNGGDFVMASENCNGVPTETKAIMKF
ncbi:hypothetical protein AAVH_32846 [Aphelenchoides avenae]|nr:hypothetical protein AAVH_32846 [Aphelenchus avenae]